MTPGPHSADRHAADTVSVLVVEGNEAVRIVLEDPLIETGLHVTDTADPRKVLAHSDRAGPPAVLITDMDPRRGVDGFELATAARRRWPCIGIVFTGGRPQHLHERRLHSRDCFLPEPFRNHGLHRTVHEVMAAT